jgi:hypothetical protein
MAYLSRNESKPNPNITLNFKPTSVGTMRLLFQFQASIKMLHELGLSEDETDQVVLNNLCFSVSRFFFRLRLISPSTFETLEHEAFLTE